MPVVDEAKKKTTRFFTPQRVLLQMAGFSVGIALLVWVVQKAAANGQWEKVFHTDPKLFVALISFSLASTILNGSTFWITVQPIKRLQFWHMQWLNLTGNMLNYAPHQQRDAHTESSLQHLLTMIWS